MPETNDEAFTSIGALKAAHIALLERRRHEGDGGELIAAVTAFIERGSATGTILEADPDRWAGQSVLDYWANVVYRAGYDAIDSALADFDPLCIPELDDALCPYIGLDPFREPTQALFFGRQRTIADLVERLWGRRLLAVVGPSGSGKSSLVLGGLLPVLKAGALKHSERWRYLPPIVPGSDPLGALDRLGLASGISDDVPPSWADQRRLTILLGDTPTVLVVDQFEELFTLCEDTAARDAFIANLLALADAPGQRHTVILTMRSDFESFVARVPELHALWESALARVVPLNAAELREAIERPATAVGLRFEAGVIEGLLQDILGEPAALPLLQFTLLKLWEERERNRVPWSVYARLGGGRLALARSADAFYDELIPEDQIAARRLLLRMVRPGDGLEVTSSRVRRATLEIGGEARDRIDRVIGKLVAARLVRQTAGETPADDQLEVAHEALVRNWPRLVGWLEDERVALAARRRLEAKANEWLRLGRGSGGLLDEIQLRDAERWLLGPDAAYVGYNEALHALVQSSRDAIDAARRDAEQQQLELARAQAVADIQRRRAEEQAQVSRRSRRLVAVLLGLLALTAAAMFVALNQTSLARRSATEAQTLALAGGAQAALSKGNTDLALALALAANQLDGQQQQAQLTLAEAAYAPGTRRRLVGHTAGVQSVAIAPDGRTAVSGSRDTTLIVWDLASGTAIRTLSSHSDVVNSVAIGPDGKTALSGSDDNSAIVWDLAGGARLRTLSGHTGPVNGVAISPDGKTALSGSSDTTLILWDLASGARLRTLSGHTGPVNGVAFAPDGRTAVSASDDTTLIIWDLASGARLRTLSGHSGIVFSVAVSPDGKTALSGSSDATLILWDLSSGAPIRSFVGHARDVFHVAFSRDGRAALSGSRDSQLAIWDVATGRRLRILVGHGAAVQSGAFSPDDRAAISASSDFTLRLWDLRSGAELQQMVGHGGRVIAARYSPDGTTFVSGSGDTTLMLWDAASGRRIWTFAGHTAAVAAVAFSPDGTKLLSGSTDKTLILWDVASGKQLRLFAGHSAEVSSVAFSPDGRLAVSGAGDKRLIVWNVTSGAQLRTLVGHSEKVNSVVFSPDGTTIASGSRDASIRLWNAASGTTLRTLVGHTAAVRTVAFSPDGRQLLSGSEDKHVLLWDVASGKLLRQLDEHSAAVWSVAFSADGRLAISGSDDATAIVWDLTSGAVLRRFAGHAAAVRTASFSPDGRTALTGSDDATLIRWRLDTLAELIAWTRANRYTPPITCDQRSIYRLAPLCPPNAAP